MSHCRVLRLLLLMLCHLLLNMPHHPILYLKGCHFLGLSVVWYVMDFGNGLYTACVFYILLYFLCLQFHLEFPYTSYVYVGLLMMICIDKTLTTQIASRNRIQQSFFQYHQCADPILFDKLYRSSV